MSQHVQTKKSVLEVVADRFREDVRRLMFSGRLYHEGDLVALATAFEAAVGGGRAVPPLFAPGR